jgi:hypothetical protein
VAIALRSGTPLAFFPLAFVGARGSFAAMPLSRSIVAADTRARSWQLPIRFPVTVKKRVLVQAAPDKQISLTDPDARSMATSGKGTGVVGYNVQTVVDAQHPRE